MKYFKRHDEPEFLQQNAARWNQKWADLKSRKPGAQFNWYQYDGKPVNQRLAPLLLAQTQDHCSYCDAYPPQLGDKTIDHFCPKVNSYISSKLIPGQIYTRHAIIVKPLRWKVFQLTFFALMHLIIPLIVILFTIFLVMKLG